jgi:ADP-heptose:LPS heptosyltransferase
MPHTHAAYNCVVPYAFESSAHQIEICAGVLRPFGVELQHRWLEFLPGREAEDESRRALAAAGVEDGGPFVVVHPGSKQVYNRWPLDRFLAVYEHCRSSASLRTLLSFGPHEGEARRWFLARGVPARDLLPRLSITGLAALLRSARLLVCPDTGVLHVGAAAGVPTVGLYGSGDPSAWQPPGPIRAVTDHERGDVLAIPVGTVLCEVDAVLGAGSREVDSANY